MPSSSLTNSTLTLPGLSSAGVPENWPIKISWDKYFGRHLVAAREIRSSEILIQEFPLNEAPSDATLKPDEAPCLGCCKIVKIASYSCESCGWTLCGPNCSMLDRHALNECLFLKADNRGRNDFVELLENDYLAIQTLRLLLLKLKFPERWNMVLQLATHQEERKANLYSAAKYDYVVNFIRDRCGLSLPENEIDRAFGAIWVNAYNGKTDCQAGRGISFLFWFLSFMNHSCTPNVTLSSKLVLDKSSGEVRHLVEVRATRSIQANTRLFISYFSELPPNPGLGIRCPYLKQHWFFVCDCLKCRAEYWEELPFHVMPEDK